MNRNWTSKWLVALGCLAVFSMVMAAEPAPSGTVKLTSKAVAIGIGVTLGRRHVDRRRQAVRVSRSKVSASPTSAFPTSRLRAKSSI